MVRRLKQQPSKYTLVEEQELKEFKHVVRRLNQHTPKYTPIKQQQTQEFNMWYVG